MRREEGREEEREEGRERRREGGRERGKEGEIRLEAIIMQYTYMFMRTVKLMIFNYYFSRRCGYNGNVPGSC